MNLLEQVADFQNLLGSLRLCARGKRQSRGFQEMQFRTGELLLEIRQALLGEYFSWGNYRQFEIRDPKKRLISAAPFRDRVVHTAICRVIEPGLDSLLAPAVYACRQGRGNRNAVIDLIGVLRRFGRDRFVMKLDVQRYFESIVHEVLFSKLSEKLPDRSLDGLLTKLLASHPDYGPKGIGLPIGNLTSQLFANFYLASADALVLEENPEGFYFRYMDDFIIGSRSKSKTLDTCDQLIAHLQNHLRLDIPISKRVPLANDPVPFLGFLVDHLSYQPLSRNGRRHLKSIKRLATQGAPDSRLAITEISFRAWANLEPHLSRRMVKTSI